MSNDKKLADDFMQRSLAGVEIIDNQARRPINAYESDILTAITGAAWATQLNTATEAGRIRALALALRAAVNFGKQQGLSIRRTNTIMPGQHFEPFRVEGKLLFRYDPAAGVIRIRRNKRDYDISMKNPHDPISIRDEHRI